MTLSDLLANSAATGIGGALLGYIVSAIFSFIAQNREFKFRLHEQHVQRITDFYTELLEALPLVLAEEENVYINTVLLPLKEKLPKLLSMQAKAALLATDEVQANLKALYDFASKEYELLTRWSDDVNSWHITYTHAQAVKFASSYKAYQDILLSSLLKAQKQHAASRRRRNNKGKSTRQKLHG